LTVFEDFFPDIMLAGLLPDVMG
jgi:hypothetical protein